MKAYWTEVEQRTLTSRDELMALIAEVKGLSNPTMVFLESEDGRVLALGVGGSESVLALIERDGMSFHSIGDTSRTGTLKFWCRDQLDEFMAEMAVSESSAIDTALAFFSQSALPSNVRWEADW